ncbi:hypothetical protein SLS62_003120 [Diatrype stigma]|uniref:Uncharacterized protein n=1 Tax=Diatrype stigma TaxID=117547 RepID=A0AAN9YRL4_9PEZI
MFLALSAAFALTAKAFPFASNDKDSIEPTLSLGPHFVPYTNGTETAETHPALLQARFDKPFTAANDMQVLCSGATAEEGSQYRSKESDCLAAVTKLAKTNGYWDCTGWTDGSNLRYFVLFEYGTCKAYAMANADKPTK